MSALWSQGRPMRAGPPSPRRAVALPVAHARGGQSRLRTLRRAAMGSIRWLSAVSLVWGLLWSLSAVAAPEVVAVALFKNGAMLEIDGVRRTLRAGMRSPEGCLLVSATSKQAVVECGGQPISMGLNDRVGGTYQEPDRAVVRVNPDRRGQYQVRGTINSQVVDLVVDTGASVVALSGDHARQLGIVITEQTPKAMLRTAQGRTKSHLVRLAEITVGTITVRNVEAAVIDGAYPREILLGMSYLKYVGMSQDVGGVLVLEAK